MNRSKNSFEKEESNLLNGTPEVGVQPTSGNESVKRKKANLKQKMKKNSNTPQARLSIIRTTLADSPENSRVSRKNKKKLKLSNLFKLKKTKEGKFEQDSTKAQKEFKENEEIIIEKNHPELGKSKKIIVSGQGSEISVSREASNFHPSISQKSVEEEISQPSICENEDYAPQNQQNIAPSVTSLELFHIKSDLNFFTRKIRNEVLPQFTDHKIDLKKIIQKILVKNGEITLGEVEAMFYPDRKLACEAQIAFYEATKNLLITF